MPAAHGSMFTRPHRPRGVVTITRESQKGRNVYPIYYTELAIGIFEARGLLANLQTRRRGVQSRGKPLMTRASVLGCKVVMSEIWFTSPPLPSSHRPRDTALHLLTVFSTFPFHRHCNTAIVTFLLRVLQSAFEHCTLCEFLLLCDLLVK
jgi:hypothetical protein